MCKEMSAGVTPHITLNITTFQEMLDDGAGNSISTANILAALEHMEENPTRERVRLNRGRTSFTIRPL